MILDKTKTRYDHMFYRRCGNSGLLLPEISLGLWHNFGGVDDFRSSEQMIIKAFDLGITHFDLANNYGPPPGSAEETFGKIIFGELNSHRDELIISTKAGYYMWAGPYGEWGSRKYLLASLDQSLKRMNLDYVDIFYSHRYDPNTPLEETALALDTAVKQGKTLYVGISNYPPEETQKMCDLFKEFHTPFIIHQPRYSMFDRHIEDGLLDVLEKNGKGCIVYSPLAQGMLTNKYINGIPTDSRAAKAHGFLKTDQITEVKIKKIKKLNELAIQREQTLAQMAIAWILRDKTITSVLVGTSTINQLNDNVDSLRNTDFTSEELSQIEIILQL